MSCQLIYNIFVWRIFFQYTPYSFSEYFVFWYFWGCFSMSYYISVNFQALSYQVHYFRINIHKVLWNSSDNNTKNQIDYFSISKTFWSSVKDTRLEADTGSNQNLCIVKLKIKLKKLHKPCKNKKMDSQYLHIKDLQTAYNIKKHVFSSNHYKRLKHCKT